MGAESIDMEGFEKLFKIIKNKERDIKRFKEGFNLTIKRNIELKTITEYEAHTLKTELNMLRA